jgi:chemotaxis response regulator CheB
VEAPAVLDHEPAQQRRPFRDRFDHRDDAVDVVEEAQAPEEEEAGRPYVPPVIDPLLSQQQNENKQDN